MSIGFWITTLIEKAFNKTKTTVILAGYNAATICKYFRKQGALIGEGCTISTKSLGPEPYLVSIGNNVFVSYGVIFHTHDGGVQPLRKKYPLLQIYGPIIIEDNCIIGRNAQLLPNIRIGKNAIVGAGSVVISDVPPDTIVMGVPARPIGSVSKYEKKCLEIWKSQKPPELDDTKKTWRSKHDQKILRKHLIELFMNPETIKRGPEKDDQ